MAEHFEIRHDNLIRQNIRKLQKEKHLPLLLLNFKEQYIIGNNAQKFYTIYALTRHQVEYLIMDLQALAEPEPIFPTKFLEIILDNRSGKNNV